MCGRFAASSSTDRLTEHFGLDDVSPQAANVEPSWNVPPSSAILAVRQRDGLRTLDVVRWGLVPSWASAPGTGAKMINARAETLPNARAYRGPLARRRAIIPMDGFYEWRREPAGGRQPYYFSAPGGEPLAVAGLWDAWRDPGGAWLLSAAVITTAAGFPVAEIHDRMPVVLNSHSIQDWLDCESVGPAEAAALLRAPVTDLAAWPVDRAVNSVANDSPELVRPVPS